MQGCLIKSWVTEAVVFRWVSYPLTYSIVIIMSKNWIGRQVQFFVTFSTLHQRAVKVGMYINNCICNLKYEFSSKYSSECYYRNNGRYIRNDSWYVKFNVIPTFEHGTSDWWCPMPYWTGRTTCTLGRSDIGRPSNTWWHSGQSAYPTCHPVCCLSKIYVSPSTLWKL